MQLLVAGAKRGKTRASKSRLVLGLLLIGWESGARFLVIALVNHNRRRQSCKPITTQSKYMSAGAKRGKTRASKSQLVLVLLVIGWKSGARFLSQSQSVAMQNQSNREITFDTQLKTLLTLKWKPPWKKTQNTIKKKENMWPIEISISFYF